MFEGDTSRTFDRRILFFFESCRESVGLWKYIAKIQEWWSVVTCDEGQ